MGQLPRRQLEVSAWYHNTLSLTVDDSRVANKRRARTGMDAWLDALIAELPECDGQKRLGSSLIEAPLGRGAMGAVFRGRDLERGIDVAVKVLFPCDSPARRDALRRFEREARFGRAIDHPNIVQVLGAGTCARVNFLVMEYIDGETILERVQRTGPLPLGEALAITRRACRGLAAAHRAGVVHRDIKPANVMLGSFGEVKVCDLGLAKALGSSCHLTLAHKALGTPSYMAPEQWRDARTVGPASDVYSLGATLYFMLTGRPGLCATTLSDLRRVIAECDVPDLRTVVAGIPDEVAALVAQCVARTPDCRYADAGAVLCALDPLAHRFETSLLPGAALIA